MAYTALEEGRFQVRVGSDFSADANCVALWRFEDGALTTDSKGTNTLTNVNTVIAKTTDFKEGISCGEF